MHHEPRDTDPTTHHELDDVEAHGLGGKKVPPAADDVQAHNWANKPPIVDDVQAHGMKFKDPADDVEAHGGRFSGEPTETDE